MLRALRSDAAAVPQRPGCVRRTATGSQRRPALAAPTARTAANPAAARSAPATPAAATRSRQRLLVARVVRRDVDAAGIDHAGAGVGRVDVVVDAEEVVLALDPVGVGVDAV